jgi:hypothetical protein
MKNDLIKVGNTGRPALQRTLTPELEWLANLSTPTPAAHTRSTSSFEERVNLNDFAWYRAFVPNYGDRHRHGKAISTAFVESTVNQVVSKRMVKQQQMRWTQQGAHLLLQIRTQALNGDLRGNFCRWYPGMERDSQNQDGMAAAA